MPDLDYVQPGDSLTFPVAGAALTAGDWLVVGAILGVVKEDAASGAPYTIQVRGVFRNAPKTTGAAWTVGDVLYWETTGPSFTKTASGNTEKGYAAAAAASAAAVGTVLLTNASGLAVP